MIMDNTSHARHHIVNTLPLRVRSPQRADLNISTTPPLTPSPGFNMSSNGRTDIHSPTTATVGTTKPGFKRSFDVAFLMMPDERIAHKQAVKQPCLTETFERRLNYPTDLSPRHLVAHQQSLQDVYEKAPDNKFIPLPDIRRHPQLTVRSPRIYDDPSVILPDSEITSSQPIKSAFTKVVNTHQESPILPPQSLSPDQLSSSSLSPPISTPPPRTGSGNDSLSNGSNGNSAIPLPPHVQPGIIYHNFRPDYSFNGAFQSVSQVQALQVAAAAQNQRIRHQLLYRPPPITTAPASHISPNNGTIAPEFLPAYPAFPFSPASGPAAHHFAAITAPELPRIPLQNPAAAAILSTLIPPTLASTLSLTAQNVCAKCNISFRMTSDLVYHMRSHHKSEVACDPNRRKREEKLKCPVCNESFRERHHLTRHMTAHQDKESDSATTSSAGNDNEPIIHVGNGHGNSRNHMRGTSSIAK